MKKKVTLFPCLCLPLFGIAQTLPREYEYDDAGNRTLRKVVNMKPPDLMPPPPPAPQDTTINQETSDLTELTSQESLEALMSLTSLESSQPPALAPPPEHFVETLAQVEIKIFPNPTTEKITLEISQWETLQQGVFKLFTLTGQLLQERHVHAAVTEISLTGLATGAYILKVQINERVEDWKVIKN
jgi:hypothetical protein